MESDAVDQSQKLNELSRAKAIELIPISVYVCVLMVVGLFGNLIVCIFYGKKTKATPTNQLIVTVAVIDTVICVMMPKNIVDLSLSYKFTSSFLCQMNYFVNHTTAKSSILALVSIAIFRYRMVCQPFKKQFTLKHTKIAIIVSVLLAMAMSIPVLFVYESVAYNISTVDNTTIQGFDCNSTKKPSLKILLMLSNIMSFLLFIASATAFGFLYGRMGIKIWRHLKRKRMLKVSTAKIKQPIGLSKANYSSEGDIDTDTYWDDTVTESKCDSQGGLESIGKSLVNGKAVEVYGQDIGKINACDDANDVKEDENNAKECQVVYDPVKKEFDVKVKRVTSVKHHDKQAWQAKSSQRDGNDAQLASSAAARQTLMLLVITLIFVASFLPYLVMTVIRTATKEERDELTNGIQFCMRTYLINSASNPFVYGLFNSQFRRYVKSLFWR